MQDSPATREELHEVEERGEKAMLQLAQSIKTEVRWLIVASVGLNQVFNNVDLTGVAKAGIAGAFLVIAKVGIQLFSAR